jgi:hypothetical protein
VGFITIFRRACLDGITISGHNSTDYPASQWPLSLDTVQLTFENTIHYGFDTELGDAEWNKTLPSGGAVLHLGPDFRPYTLGVFHEIRCLNIIRKALVDYYADESANARIRDPKKVHHCMNYLRQMVLCRADLKLEWVRAPRGNHVTVWEVTHTCKDWTAIYDAAEGNYASYQGHLKV